MASLRKRKTKKGISYFIDYYNRNKERKRLTLGIISKKRAEHILDGVRGNLAMGKFGIPEKNSNEISLKDFIEKYLEYSKANKASGSYENDNYALSSFLNFVGNKNLSDINIIDVENYKLEKLEYLNKSSINRDIKIIKAMFRYAKKIKAIQENPIQEVTIFKIQKSNIPGYLTNIQIKKLLNSIKDKDREFKNLILFYLYTGCRRNEALNLKWSDVNLKKRQILLRETKTNKARAVPMNPKLYSILKNSYGHIIQDDKKVFDFDPKYVSYKFKYYLNLIGCRVNKSVHILRHTFASHLVKAGVDLYRVQKLLGHSSIRMTEIYSHLAPADYKEAVKKLHF